jgi:hypothetical protein
VSAKLRFLVPWKSGVIFPAWTTAPDFTEVEIFLYLSILPVKSDEKVLAAFISPSKPIYYTHIDIFSMKNV